MELNKNLIKQSKHLSYLLRHQKEEPQIDDNGYALVKEVLQYLKDVSLNDLKLIVENNDKKRFEFSKDFSKIRAVQGHTINVDVELNEQIPPKILYHGTYTKAIPLIKKNGINKMKRLYVHLTENINIAKDNGKRFGNPCVIIVDTEQMSKDGIKFFKSKNNIWLTNFVDTKYIKEIQYF